MRIRFELVELGKIVADSGCGMCADAVERPRPTFSAVYHTAPHSHAAFDRSCCGRAIHFGDAIHSRRPSRGDVGEDCRTVADQPSEPSAQTGRIPLGRRHRHSLGAAVAARRRQRDVGLGRSRGKRRLVGHPRRRARARSTASRSRCGPTCASSRRCATPTTIEDVHVVVPARQSQPNIASRRDERASVRRSGHRPEARFHFRLGKPKISRTIRVARDLLLDVDEKSQISGLWLLNVPPCPAPLGDEL